jgi:hypothetical protein
MSYPGKGTGLSLHEVRSIGITMKKVEAEKPRDLQAKALRDLASKFGDRKSRVIYNKINLLQ